MHRISRTLGSLLLWSAATAFAADPLFELNDGTQVRGSIEKMTEGVYTVRSPSLGVLEIRATDIKTIHYSGRIEPANDEPNYRSDIESLQLQMAREPGTMALIQGLQSDPQVQAVLADPDILRLIQSGDLSALMANEKFMRLMENAKIKAVTSQISGR